MVQVDDHSTPYYSKETLGQVFFPCSCLAFPRVTFGDFNDCKSLPGEIITWTWSPVALANVALYDGSIQHPLTTSSIMECPKLQSKSFLNTSYNIMQTPSSLLVLNTCCGKTMSS